MKYKKTIKKIYKYECNFCGNQFTRNYEVYPYSCYQCQEIETFNETIETIEVIEQFCPICETYFKTSEYLNKHFEDEHVRWLANMITHYRHEHQKSWDRMWGYNGYFYRKKWGKNLDYDESKKEFNERAKRQILRKCKVYMIENGFKTEHVKKLKNTDEDTIKLYDKLLKENNLSQKIKKR